MAEWSKAADCKSVRKLSLVRTQFFSTVMNIKRKDFYKDFYFNVKDQDVQLMDTPVLCSVGYPRGKVLASTLKTNLYTRDLAWYTFDDRGYNSHRRKFHNPTKILSLNFTRQRFFPTLRTTLGETYFFLSLGLLAKFLLKNKAFVRNKAVFILLASFLRKILLFSSFKNLYLFINKTPLYFKEVMATISNPVVSIYKNPFSRALVSEKRVVNPFTFPIIIFTNNKPYGFMKTKKKGRLKRKIAKRLVAINRVLD